MQLFNNSFQFLYGAKRGGAAAEIERFHNVITKFFCPQSDFLRQGVNVLCFQVCSAHRIEIAIDTFFFAEREMNVYSTHSNMLVKLPFWAERIRYVIQRVSVIVFYY